MSKNYAMIAKTFQGLEEVLAQELTALGANDVEIGRRMVSFSGDKEMMYRANFCLRTAIRILKPIKEFTAKNADEVYEAIKNIVWEDYLDEKKTFAIDSVVFSNEFRHSMFVSYKVKDAIADYFREKTGKRPSVRIHRPDLSINIHIAETKCTVSLDSSGDSLHRRGYRQEAVEAPLNEVLAAGIILQTGWKGETDFVDPMCGSGTLPIEAALIARNIYPGIFRKEFAFERWADFDQELLEEIYNDDSQEKAFEHHIYAYDNSPGAIEIAAENIKAAGVSKDVTFALRPIQRMEQPEQPTLMVTNPPYGERISSDDLLGLYQVIGERLKHAFIGNTAWILSYREECFNEIGLKPTLKLPLFNGPLECELRQYEIFDGKLKVFKEEHAGDEKPKREFRGREKSDFRGSRDRNDRGDRSDRGEGRDSDRRGFGKPERRFDSNSRTDRDRRQDDRKFRRNENSQDDRGERSNRFERNDRFDRAPRRDRNDRFESRDRGPRIPKEVKKVPHEFNKGDYRKHYERRLDLEKRSGESSESSEAND